MYAYASVLQLVVRLEFKDIIRLIFKHNIINMKGYFAFFVAVALLGQMSFALDEGVMPITPVGTCPPIDGKIPVYLPDSARKDIFYECSHGRPILIQCRSGLEFNPKFNVCDYPA